MTIFIAPLGAKEAAAATINSSNSAFYKQGIGLNRGLKGWWTFDGTDITATQALDKSGTGNTGAIGGAVKKVTGKIGQAFSFNGTASTYVNAGNNSSLDITGSITKAIWVKTSNLSQLGGVLCKDSSGRSSIFFEGALKWRGGDINPGLIYSVPSALNNQWFHVAVTQSGTTAIMYINGVAVTSNSGVPAIITYPTQAETIGALPGGSYLFNGSLDDARVYNRALSPSEVKQLYQMGTALKIGQTANPGKVPLGINSGLIGYWPMDGGDFAGANTYDRSGAGRNGTSNGNISKTIGKIGQATKFDGGDYFDAGANPITGTNPFTIAAWIKTTSVAFYSGALFIGTSASFAGAYIGTVGTAQLGSSNSIGGGWYGQNYGSGVATLNEWAHVAMTFAGGSSGAVKLYVNGQYKVGENFTPSLGTDSIRIGRIGSDAGYDFSGSIDDARVYSRALSAAEIQQLYRMGEALKVSQTPTVNKVPLGINSGLVGHWTFDGKDVSGNTIYDRSVSANNGTNVGAVKTTGKIGQAMSFDGGTDMITAGPVSLSRYSVSVWVKPSRNQSGSAAIISDQYPSYVNYTLYFQDSSTNVLAGTYDSGWYSTPAVTLSMNSWSHLVSTYDGAKIRLYVNGAFTGSVDYVGNPQSSGTQLNIGKRWDLPDYYCGAMDDLRLYNRPLSITEIKQLYQMGK